MHTALPWDWSQYLDLAAYWDVAREVTNTQAEQQEAGDGCM